VAYLCDERVVKARDNPFEFRKIAQLEKTGLACDPPSTEKHQTRVCSCHFESSRRRKEMKANPQFASVLSAACVSFLLSLPAVARPANAQQDQGTTQTQSSTQNKNKNQKAGTSPGKDVGKGGADIGKGTAKGAGSLGKGTAGAVGNAATLHPGKAAGDLGKGAAGAGKDVGVGAGKGAGKIGEGSAKGVGKLGKKIFHRGSKNKEKDKAKSGA
jgi:hypothetical protein